MRRKVGTFTLLGLLWAITASAQTEELVITRIGATANLTIAPTGDLVVDPTGNDLYPSSSYDVNLGLITAKWAQLHAAELWVGTLVAQQTMATIGGRILVAPTTTLVVAPSTGGAFAVKHNNLMPGDMLYLEANGEVEFVTIYNIAVAAVNTGSKYFEFNWSTDACISTFYAVGRQFAITGSTGNDGTYTVASCTYSEPNTRVVVDETVPSAVADGSFWYFDDTDQTPPYYTYRVGRNQDGSGINTWAAGDTVVSTGGTGDGFLDIYSVRGVKASSEAGPTMVGNVRTSTTYNAWAPRWAIGELNGLYGYSSTTYGAAFGNPSDVWIGVDATNGIRISEGGSVRAQWDTSGNILIGRAGSGQSNVYITSDAVKLRTQTTDKIVLDTSGNVALTGNLSVGTAGAVYSGQTAYNTGTGWWLEYNAGTPRLSIGNASGARLLWTGTDVEIVSSNLRINAGENYVILGGTAHNDGGLRFGSVPADPNSANGYTGVTAGSNQLVLVSGSSGTFVEAGTNDFVFTSDGLWPNGNGAGSLGKSGQVFDEVWADIYESNTDAYPLVKGPGGQFIAKTNGLDGTQNFPLDGDVVTICFNYGIAVACS